MWTGTIKSRKQWHTYFKCTIWILFFFKLLRCLKNFDGYFTTHTYRSTGNNYEQTWSLWPHIKYGHKQTKTKEGRSRITVYLLFLCIRKQKQTWLVIVQNGGHYFDYYILTNTTKSLNHLFQINMYKKL